MKVITRYLKIYLYFWKVAGKLSAMYRTDSIMLFVGVVFIIFLQAFFFDAIYKTTQTIGGWNINEIFLLLGVFQVNYGAFKVFYGRAMEDSLDKIFNGEYDFFLLKPIRARFLAFALPPMFKGLPTLAVGFVFIYYGLSNLNIQISIFAVLFFVLYILISQLILYALFLIVISAAFWAGKADELYGIVENACYYGRYPGSVFQGSVFAFLTFVIPITLIASYPTSVLLQKVEFSPINLLYPVLVALVLLILSNFIYKQGVKNYSSASS